MGYYNDLMLRSYEACGKDAAEGIHSDPMKTAQAIARADNIATQNTAPARRWWTAKVRNVQPKLGPGFRQNGTCYVSTTHYGDETIILVFNGNYGIRHLTQAEAKRDLVLGKKMGDKESYDIEERYQWELYR